MKFIKKPIEVEAIQWLGWNNLECLEFTGATPVEIRGNSIYIETPEGVMICSIHDWLIKGIKGEIYPCKPDVFNLTYREPYEADPDVKWRNIYQYMGGFVVGPEYDSEDEAKESIRINFFSSNHLFTAQYINTPSSAYSIESIEMLNRLYAETYDKKQVDMHMKYWRKAIGYTEHDLRGKEAENNDL